MRKFTLINIIILLYVSIMATRMIAEKSVDFILTGVSREQASEDIRLCSIFVAERITDVYYKPWMFSEVASTFAKSGQRDLAAAILEKALMVASTIEDESYKSDALLEISEGYAEINNFDKALKVAGRIRTPLSRTKGFNNIARKYIENKETQKAEQILFVALIGAGVMKGKAADTANKEIALTYAKMGKFQEALSVAMEIKDSEGRVEALTVLASAGTETGEKEKTMSVLERAVETAELVGDNAYAASSYALISMSYAKAGEKEAALKLAARAGEKLENVTSKHERQNVLLKMAEAYAELGKSDESFIYAKRIEDETKAPVAFAKAAGSYFKAGNEAKAREALEEALAVSGKIRSGYSQAKVMNNIVSVYLEMGDMKKALEAARAMKDDYTQPRALSTVALKMWQAGQKGEAPGIMAEALEVIRTIKDNFYKSWALADIAVKYNEAGIELDEKTRKTLEGIVEDVGKEEERSAVPQSL